MGEVELAYLRGALIGDGYIYTGKRKGTVVVFTQKNKEWLEKIKKLLNKLGYNAWIYKQRDIFILETKCKELMTEKTIGTTIEEKIAFLSGFFDTEGGIPKKPEIQKPVTPYFYVQFVQKDKKVLEKIINILKELDIKTGKLHQFGTKTKCWRFFIKASSLLKFLETIKS